MIRKKLFLKSAYLQAPMAENLANWPPEVVCTFFNILLAVVVRLGELRAYGLDAILPSSNTARI